MPEVNNVHHYLSPQETYNIGRKHLLTQGKKSLGPYPLGSKYYQKETVDALHGSLSCLYRSPQPDGTVLKCAIGPFIPDELYTSQLEGQRLGAIDPDVFGQTRPDLTIGSDLQAIHDGYDSSSWENRLNDLAERRNLVVVPL